MGPFTTQTSVRSVSPSIPPPEYHLPIFVQRIVASPVPRNRHKWPLGITFWTSTISLLTSLIIISLLLLSGSPVYSDYGPAIPRGYGRHDPRLPSYALLTIPIKYPFLCPTSPNQSPVRWECEAQWSLRLYLNALWAHSDVDYESGQDYLVWSGPGNVFDLPEALKWMDYNLIQWLYPQDTYTNNTLPIPLTIYIRGMTPVATRTLFILFVVGMLITVPIFIVWALEKTFLLPKGRKLVPRIFLLFAMLLTFIFWLAAAAYINQSASKAAAQLKGDQVYVSGGGKEPRFEKAWQGLVAGAMVLQITATLLYAVHCWLEKKMLKEQKEQATPKEQELVTERPRDQRVTSLDGDNARQVEEPPAYTVELTDLGRIRLTERDMEERERALMRGSEV